MITSPFILEEAVSKRKGRYINVSNFNAKFTYKKCLRNLLFLLFIYFIAISIPYNFFYPAGVASSAASRFFCSLSHIFICAERLWACKKLLATSSPAREENIFFLLLFSGIPIFQCLLRLARRQSQGGTGFFQRHRPERPRRAASSDAAHSRQNLFLQKNV